jgi:hypothetical protein
MAVTFVKNVGMITIEGGRTIRDGYPIHKHARYLNHVS